MSNSLILASAGGISFISLLCFTYYALSLRKERVLNQFRLSYKLRGVKESDVMQLSPSEFEFVRLAREQLGSKNFSFTFHIKSKVDIKEEPIAEALEELQRRHPMLQCVIDKITIPNGGLFGGNVEELVMKRKVGLKIPVIFYNRNGNKSTCDQVWNDELGKDVLSLGEIPMKIAVITDKNENGEEMDSEFMFTVRHYAADGVSFSLLCDEFFDIYFSVLKNPKKYHHEPSNFDHGFHPCSDYLLNLDAEASFWGKMRFRLEVLRAYKRIIAYRGTFFTFPRTAKQEKSNLKFNSTWSKTIKFDEETSKQIFKKCKEMKVSLNGAVTGTVITTLAEILYPPFVESGKPVTRNILIVPVSNTRILSEPKRPSHALGVSVSSIIGFKTTPDDIKLLSKPFEPSAAWKLGGDYVEHIRSELESGYASTLGKLAPFNLSQLPTTVEGFSPTATISGFGVIPIKNPGGLDEYGLVVDDMTLHFNSNIMDFPNVEIYTIQNKLSVTIMGPVPRLSEANLNDLHDGIKNKLLLMIQ